MGYTALYRKFRPTEFEDVKGQDAVVKTLKNQIRTGRIEPCISVLWNKRYRQDDGCQDICQSGEL